MSVEIAGPSLTIDELKERAYIGREYCDCFSCCTDKQTVESVTHANCDAVRYGQVKQEAHLAGAVAMQASAVAKIRKHGYVVVAEYVESIDPKKLKGGK